jgi:hypothetical protein
MDVLILKKKNKPKDSNGYALHRQILDAGQGVIKHTLPL